MQVQLKLDGLSALVMHNERLADPLDPFVQAISAISKARNKTSAQHEEIGYLEFLGGLYTAPPLTYPMEKKSGPPALPAWNVLRCLQDGGRRQKRGMDVPKGVFPLSEYATLEYDGPTDPQALWEAGTFALRKSVGIQRSRTMRTRPMFPEWSATLNVEIDPVVFDLGTIQNIWKDAGIYCGLGEMRPVYGRFTATATEVK